MLQAQLFKPYATAKGLKDIERFEAEHPAGGQRKYAPAKQQFLAVCSYI